MKTGRRTDFSKKNNSGFTLIELVVIAAIIFVLTGMIAINVTPMFTQSVRSSAEDLQQLLADTRTAAYARDNGSDSTYLEISVADNGRIKATEYVNDNAVTPYTNGENDYKYLGNYKETLVAKKRTSTSTSTSSSGSVTSSDSEIGSIGTGQNLYIAFEKGTGEVYCFTLAKDWADAKNATKFNDGVVSDAVITLQGNGSTFEVTVDGVTGRSKYTRIY
ncbi:MAG: type II secretion system protein [Lachnospiraceae bacterium]|nr:type II secretion system protein [Lachnospiraceae bacterium]MDY4164668.1 type II secretion system protein [Lachnospiraceae bacterium]